MKSLLDKHRYLSTADASNDSADSVGNKEDKAHFSQYQCPKGREPNTIGYYGSDHEIGKVVAVPSPAYYGEANVLQKRQY